MVSIVCPKCGFMLESAEDGTNTYEVNEWTKVCEHQDNGTPLLCEKMKTAIALHAVKPDSDTRETPQ